MCLVSFCLPCLQVLFSFDTLSSFRFVFIVVVFWQRSASLFYCRFSLWVVLFQCFAFFVSFHVFLLQVRRPAWFHFGFIPFCFLSFRFVFILFDIICFFCLFRIISFFLVYDYLFFVILDGFVSCSWSIHFPGCLTVCFVFTICYRLISCLLILRFRNVNFVFWLLCFISARALSVLLHFVAFRFVSLCGC